MNCEPVKNKLCSERFFVVMNCEPVKNKLCSERFFCCNEL